MSLILNVHGKCFSLKARIQKFSKLVEISCLQEIKSKLTFIPLYAWYASFKHVSCVYTYHKDCRSVFHEKYLLVWLLFFVNLCSQKELVKALTFNFYVHKAPFKVKEQKTMDWCLPGTCTHHNYISKQYSTYIKLITWCL